MKSLSAHFIMLSQRASRVVGPPREAYGAGVSDECKHAPLHLVMHRHKDQEESCLRDSFNAAVLWEEIGCAGC